MHTLATDIHTYLEDIRLISQSSSVALLHLAQSAPEPLAAHIRTVAAAAELISDKAVAARSVNSP